MRKIVLPLFLSVMICTICTKAFAQNTASMDKALREAADYFYKVIPAGSTIAIINTSPERSGETDLIVEEFNKVIVNDRVLFFGERGDLAELVEQEKVRHMTGRVDIATQVEMGRELGAHSIISATVTKAEGGYRVQIQSVNVLTATRSGMWSETVSRLADETWKNKSFYIGAALGLGISSFSDAAAGFLPGYANRDFKALYTIDGEIRFSFSFIENLGLQTGLIFGADSFELYNPVTDHYLTSITYRTITLPIMAKAMYYVNIVRLQAYGGVYKSFALGQMEIDDGKNSVKADFDAPYGFIAGAGIGIKYGSGLVTLDGRYMSDMSDISVKSNGVGGNAQTDLGKRQKINILLGYAFGF
jgi:hypothetical protein